MTRYLVQVLLEIGALAAIALFMRRRQRYNYGSAMVLLLTAAGGYVFFDGFSLAVLEESRTRYGRVVSGIVQQMESSTPADSYERFCRFLLTGSTDQLRVTYLYRCGGRTGTCTGQEYVSRDLWNRLSLGEHVNVRQSIDEKTTGRLDDNPQRGLAIVKTALACVLLAMAALVSGRIGLFRGRKYVEVDAVVTSVEPVRYGRETRWKVHFAYFDAKGNSQDSVDEVNDPSWKSGENCRAVYAPRTPDLATLRPRSDHQAGVAPERAESSLT